MLKVKINHQDIYPSWHFIFSIGG